MDRMMKDLICSYVPATEGSSRTLDEEELSCTASRARTRRTPIPTWTASASPLRRSGASGKTAGLCEVGYYLKEMESSQDRYVLIRSEDPLPHYGASESPQRWRWPEHLSMNIVYVDQDGNEKTNGISRKSWPCRSRVKVTIAFDAGSQPFVFTGSAYLPLSELKLT